MRIVFCYSFLLLLIVIFAFIVAAFVIVLVIVMNIVTSISEVLGGHREHGCGC